MTQQLYTRQQIAALTGADATLLNFWMREGVLRPSTGGGGKGQHRRFPYEEVNLAAILYRLKRFGVSILAAREIANICHDAVDAIGRMQLNPREFSAAKDLMLDREWYLAEGYVEILLDSDGRMSTIGTSVRQTWEEYISTLRADEYGEKYNDRVLSAVENTDPSEFWRVDNILSLVSARNNVGKRSSAPDYFYVGTDGRWKITDSATEAAAETDAFIAIDIDRLRLAVWSDGPRKIGALVS